MQLGLPGGPSIHLSVVGYEFPELTTPNDLDANWLIIAARVQLEDGRSWKFTHPCMVTHDAMQLLAWLQLLSEGGMEVTQAPAAVDTDGDGLTFMEPLLSFTPYATREGNIVVRIALELEALPPWEQSREEGQFVLVVPVDRSSLRIVADEWRDDIAPFPPR